MSRQQEQSLLEFDWIVSFLFWICLFAAGLIFGALVLSPKLEVYWGLEAERDRNAERLESLEQEVTYLGDVVTALQHDPTFQAELARIDLRPATPVGNEPTLDLHLSIASPRQHGEELVDELSAEPSEGWLARKNRSLVEDQILRNKLYLILAGMILFAFVFLQDNPDEEAD